MIGLPREEKKRAEKEAVRLFNQRENYLNGLYGGPHGHGAAPQSDNPCP
jgi:hypothetical protein